MGLRVLHILDHSLPLQSGYAFRSAALLREQRAMGWETFHLTTPKHYAPGPEEEEVDGLHFFRTPVRSNWLRRAPLISIASVVWDTQRRIEQLWDRIRPDIIHAHSPCLNGLAALQVARSHRVPVVYEMRSSWEDAAVDHGTTRAGTLRYRVSRDLETLTLKRADAITTICRGLVKDIAVRGIPAERITVIPNAVNIEDFTVIERRDEALHEALQLGPGPVLGFVGSFYGYEGIDLAIAAMPQILQRHPHATLLLVGGGYAEAELKRLAQSLQLGSHVRFVGRVPHAQVHRYYSVIDALVYPRKSMRLTDLVTPLKPLESMALGRLFAASDVGGHVELIPEHLRAYVFKAGDAEDLARVVLRLLDDKGQWATLIAAGRKYVSEQCTWRHSASRYRDVYAGLVRDGARGSRHASAA